MCQFAIVGARQCALKNTCTYACVHAMLPPQEKISSYAPGIYSCIYKLYGVAFSYRIIVSIDQSLYRRDFVTLRNVSDSNSNARTEISNQIARSVRPQPVDDRQVHEHKPSPLFPRARRQ